MKLLDKIVFAAFIVNLIFLISVFLMPIFALSFPETFDSIFFSKDRTIFNLIVMPLNLIILFFWGYCIWFLFKYDRYSKSLLPLFFFNVLYAPVYYYRVKIRKRPLRNKINKPTEEIASKGKSISEEEFIDLTRNNVFGVIDLWASKESQLEYQRNVPIAQVSNELFCQWEDYYFPASDDFRQTFNSTELKLLSEFDETLNAIADITPKNLPLIDEFIETEEWKTVNNKAIEIKNKLNTVGNKL
ncbi:hypothetical protein INQ51_09170 [Maribellus sp. CM-23]|uniref:hypothetical protein n=1 Tax=Maribellus sp. CM-23 TaxID=2781026 RepID=UPI001F45D083|nr:hypothetical protein [Maribellus sp. CM-23]MCE4564480.1 hypothetical protein [Maribellus sp. CM-23]